MSASFSDATRRDDLRAAALFVVDSERQQHGFDKRVRGSADLPDVGRHFEEALGVLPLDSEVGGAIRTVDEIPCWSAVLEKLQPLWTAFPRTKRLEPELAHSEDWLALRAAVARCVERHGLWLEEIEFPITVVTDESVGRADSWAELERLDVSLLRSATVTDSRGRPIEVVVDPAVTVQRVGLPPPDAS